MAQQVVKSMLSTALRRNMLKATKEDIEAEREVLVYRGYPMELVRPSRVLSCNEKKYLSI